MLPITLLCATALNAAAIVATTPNHQPTLAAPAPALPDPNLNDPSDLGHGYTRQGDHIYHNGQRIDEAGKANLSKFQRTVGRRLKLAEDVHAESFVALSAEYAKDKNTVYYKWVSPGQFWIVKIPGADPATFQAIDSNLAKDANRVWRTDIPIRGADPATVQVVNPHFVWKDRRTVYYQFTPLIGADPGSFRHLGQAFYRDARHIYWSDTRLDNADTDTFQTVGEDTPYAVDKLQVWFGATPIKHVDPATFRLYHNHIYADANRVYVSGEGLPILDADPATFQKIADLETENFVLFKDATRHYIFDPLYIEAYTLTHTPQGVTASKPVWYREPTGTIRHAATVTATFQNNELSHPIIEMQHGFKESQIPTWELDKLVRMTDAIRESLELPNKAPQAEPNNDQPLPEPPVS